MGLRLRINKFLPTIIRFAMSDCKCLINDDTPISFTANIPGTKQICFLFTDVHFWEEIPMMKSDCEPVC